MLRERAVHERCSLKSAIDSRVLRCVLLSAPGYRIDNIFTKIIII